MITVERLEEMFNGDDDNGSFHDEFLKFERIENKRSQRPDLHAFLLLDELCPGDSDMVDGAEHDEIFLDVELGDLAKVVTEEQVVELVRCGVRISEYDCLAMFA